MAMIPDAFVSKLCEMLVTYTKDEVVMILGVPDEIKKLHRRLERVRDVLADAENRRFENQAINRWLNELRDLMYDADDIIDECRIEGEKLLSSKPSSSSYIEPVCRCYSPILCFHKVRFRHEVGNKIKDINLKLDELIKDKNGFHLTPTPGDGHHKSKTSRKKTSSVEPHLVGEKIEADTKTLVDLLIKEYKEKISIFAIVGMGGIGKTTLARKIYNDEKLRDDFNQALMIWVCVSQEIIESDLLRSIINQVGGDNKGAKDKEVLERILIQSVRNKKFFMVLDDIWDVQVWDELLRNPLYNSSAEGRILITTRHEAIAKQMRAEYIHKVEKLSLEDGWTLISQMIFKEGDEQDMDILSDIGMKIVEKCDGLPLALRTLGGVLQTKDKRPSEWGKILASPAWTFKDLPDGVMGALYLSYQDLPTPLKQCFTIFLLFPITVFFGISMWHFINFCIAVGFVTPEENMLLKDVACGYWKELMQRSLLEPDPNSYDQSICRMHGLLLSLAQHITQNECFVGDSEAFRKKIMDSSSSIKLRHLTFVDEELEAIPDLIMEQTSLRTLVLDTPNVGILRENLFKELKYLRCLFIVDTPISDLPISLGDLVHLRLLYLSNIGISEIPKNISNLRNLQALVLIDCKCLNSLPNDIVELINLRILNVEGASLDGLPAGLSKLQQLEQIRFVVNDSEGCRSEVGRDDREQDHKGHQQERFCTLEELNSLSKLNTLSLHNLERVSNRAEARAAALGAKSHLEHLDLFCTLPSNFFDMQESHTDDYEEEKIERIKEIFQELHPPSCLEYFKIDGYFGRGFPNWMMTSSLLLFSNLRRLELHNCVLCERLPPLGMLPQLDYLSISYAFVVRTIGLEFLLLAGGIAGAREQYGRKVTSGSSTSSYFPKLEALHFEKMPNWEEWSWQWEDKKDNQTTSLLPSLNLLSIYECPKLRSLPKRFLCRATALKKLYIEGAHSLIEIQNIPAVTELVLISNLSLERISNFPALKHLDVYECEKLKDVEGVDAVEHIQLCDRESGSLPEWLIGADGGQIRFPSFQKLTLKDKIYRRGLPDWPLI